jgi:hypothetical protein
MPDDNRSPHLFKLIGTDGKPYLSPVPGLLGGTSGGKLYGRLDCWSALAAIKRKPGSYERQRVFFADEATAIAAGYRPCAKCMPVEYDAWKARQPAKADAKKA